MLQLRSVEFARNHGVVLHVRSSFSDADGTWVIEEDERMLEKAMISGVTHTLDETLYWAEGVEAAQLFAALAHAGVNVDTIVQTHDSEIVFSAPTEDGVAVAGALDGLGLTWRSRDDLAKVSLIGAGMKSHPGVAARMFAVLAEEQIEPRIVTTSPIKISCHVSRDDIERAVAALHDAFELHNPDSGWPQDA